MAVSKRAKRDHFHGKTPLRHIAEMRSDGVCAALETHGAEAPGQYFAFLDACREAAILVAVALLMVDCFDCSWEQGMAIGVSFAVGWGFWKGARSAFLSWSRLRRMHRLAVEEKEEIESNRPQEREELVALYGEKGFSGPLLDKVVDVLMADQDRLLRVMLQEEMGLRLEEEAHPLIQGVYATAGVLIAMLVLLPFAFGGSSQTVMIYTAAFVGTMGALFAKLEKNDVIPAFLWNGMLTAVTLVLVRTCMEVFSS